MIIFLISYLFSFSFAGLGWFLPSGLALMAGALYLYWKDYKAFGNLIHLRGLFCLFFAGGQGISCLKLSRLQEKWSGMTWLCFLAAILSFYLAFEWENRHIVHRRAVKSKTAVQTDARSLFRVILTVTLIALSAFILEAAVLGFIPFFLRNVPHAYSYFHISGVHYFTVSCVFVPSLFVLYYFKKEEQEKKLNHAAAGLTLVSLLIPVLCVSRFQLIFAVGMAAFTFLSINHHMPVRYGILLVGLMIPVYILLSIARSHSVDYLNGIFEMKNSFMPIFITQPYMYIANNYDNFNCLVEQLPRHTLGLRMLFPLWALTGLKFLVPALVNFPIYVNKEELTTLTLIYDAYYDFGIFGVIVFCACLGGICAFLVWKLEQISNPAGYILYAQIAMYMVLSFFTTWFSNPATWFYFAVTAGIYVYLDNWQKKRQN